MTKEQLVDASIFKTWIKNIYKSADLIRYLFSS